MHTTWQKNVSSFQALQPVRVKASQEDLFRLIHSTKVGLPKVRTAGIWKFHADFWTDPQSWMWNGTEDWQNFRDRLVCRLHGLAEAKTSFALELCYPEECGVVCLDTHMLQLYGTPRKGRALSTAKYRKVESHWLACCRTRSIPSAVVRHIYWDKIQQQPDTKYWTHVFEPITTLYLHEKRYTQAKNSSIAEVCPRAGSEKRCFPQLDPC